MEEAAMAKTGVTETPDQVRGRLSNSPLGPTSATTYFELQREQAAIEAEIVRLKTGRAPPPPLAPGQVPRIKGYVFNADRSVKAPTGADPDADPSGVAR
jgi:hypothetical protein